MIKWLEKIDATIVVIAITLLTAVVIFSLVLEKDLALKRPEIRYIPTPIYFTNTIVVIVPTNSIPLTNVITKP